MESGTYARIKLLRPFVSMDKTAIVRRGVELKVDYARTWSCYKGGLLHCGTCGTCIERREAFLLAGVPDPTPYVNTPAIPPKPAPVSLMRIAEIFHSIQGEGLLAGVPSIFIRTSGCNLRCHWCDTPYASWKPEGPEMSIEEILKKDHRLELRSRRADWRRAHDCPRSSRTCDRSKKTEKAHHHRNRRHYPSQRHSLRLGLHQPQTFQLHAFPRTGPSLGQENTRPPACNPP